MGESVDDGKNSDGTVRRVVRRRKYEATADKSVQRRLALDYHDVPFAFEWLWGVYCNVYRGRSGAGMERCLTWFDLEVWQRLKNFRLSQWEMDLLLEIDSTEPKSALSEEE